MACSWRDSAISHIYSGLLEYEAQKLALDENLDPDECRKWLNKSRYPFGAREYTPYQIWLEETRRTLFFWQVHKSAKFYESWRRGLGRKARTGSKAMSVAEDCGQLKIF